jgi:hypothetical protein
MRILYLTAGAAGMYCGSCLRDNALATELLAQGHEVTLLPLYTPTLTDERNVSQEKVFFGGISVYLQQHSPFFRFTPRALDRLWDSNFALKMVAKRSIPVRPQSLGELTISILKGEDGNQRKELDKLIDWARAQERPMSLISELTSHRVGQTDQTGFEAARLLHASGRGPLSCGTGGAISTQALELIRSNVRYIDRFIAVSDYYAAFMSELLLIPREKLQSRQTRNQPERFPSELPARRPGSLQYWLPCEWLPRRDSICWLRRTGSFESRSRESARLEVAGYLAPEHNGYLRAIERQLRSRAWRTSSAIEDSQPRGEAAIPQRDRCAFNTGNLR